MVKTALKLLLIFVEYAESNCSHLLNAVHEVDGKCGQPAWTNVLKVLSDKDRRDQEAFVYAMTLLNKVTRKNLFFVELVSP